MTCRAYIIVIDLAWPGLSVLLVSSTKTAQPVPRWQVRPKSSVAAAAAAAAVVVVVAAAAGDKKRRRERDRQTETGRGDGSSSSKKGKNSIITIIITIISMSPIVLKALCVPSACLSTGRQLDRWPIVSRQAHALCLPPPPPAR